MTGSVNNTPGTPVNQFSVLIERWKKSVFIVSVNAASGVLGVTVVDAVSRCFSASSCKSDLVTVSARSALLSKGLAALAVLWAINALVLPVNTLAIFAFSPRNATGATVPRGRWALARHSIVSNNLSIL